MSPGLESSSDGEKRFRATVEAAARRTARLFVYRLLALYYRFFYGSRRPGSRTLGRLVDWLVSQERLYDAPLRRETWDRDYSEGVWSYMARVEERPRYAVIAGYLRHFAAGGSSVPAACW